MEKLIQFALCGNYSEEFSPYTATADVNKQKILLAINSKPLSLQEIALKTDLKEHGIIENLNKLKRCQLIEEIRRPQSFFPYF